MPNILYVAQTYHPKIGGAERYIDRLAQAMANKGHNVHILAPETNADELSRDYQVIRTSFYENYKNGILYYVRAVPMARKIKSLVEENNIDVLHFQYINPFAVPIRYLKSSGAKVYATIHGSGVHFMQEDWLGKRLLIKVLSSIDGVSPVSDYCGSLATKWGADKSIIHVIYNGTDPEIFTPNPNQSKIEKYSMLTACRLVPRKDISTLLKALNEVKKKLKDAKIIVAGDGPDKPRLEELVKTLKLEKSVTFSGFIQMLYKNAGVFILPAKYDESARDIEGFGITLLEAMASGRPVIGANVGGIPSAIKKDWGLLYEPEDWKELGNKIVYLMKNQDIAERMGKNGREAVENIYNWKYIATKMEEMYFSKC
jgi:phosphatidylinositol alpha-1,6-mannosyltransferase